jgi:hypothetical protein
MKRITIILFLLQIFTAEFIAQSNHKGSREAEGIILANAEIIHKRVTVTEKDGNVSYGFLIGFKSDTLLMNIGLDRYKHCIKDVRFISIDIEHENYKGFLTGTILGLYLGSLAFFKDENQPIAYMRDIEPIGIVLMGFLSATVGGGVGYLIEKGSSKDQEVFIFSDDPNSWIAEYQRSKDFILGVKKKKLVHLSLQLSQVHTRMAELDDPDYHYYDATSFNMLRKLDITYQLTDKFCLGAAVSWFGEPEFYFSNWSMDYYNQKSIHVNQKYTGTGYYLIGYYEPLSKTGLKSISWRLGLGLGFCNIDYSVHVSKETDLEYPYQFIENEENIDKIKQSIMCCTNLDFYIHEGFSLGFSADYVYLSEKMTAIPEIGMKERNLGNYSVGFNFSLHF